MSATTQQPQPSPAAGKTNGHIDRTIKKRRKLRASKRNATAGTAPAPRGAMPQPQPSHRLARAVTKPIAMAHGVAGLTSSFVAMCADFTQQLLAAEIQPSGKQCEDWIAIFQASVNSVQSSIAKAA